MSSLSFVFLGLFTLVIIIGSDARSESISISISESSSEENFSESQGRGGNRRHGQQRGGNRGLNQRGGGRGGQAKRGGGGGNGQDTFNFSSLSKMPKSMLSKLSNSQIEKLKKQGKTGNPSNLNRKKPGTQHGGGSNGQDTFKFSSLSKMPKNLQDKFSNSQIENLKKKGKTGNPSDISPKKQDQTSNPSITAAKKTIGKDGIPTFVYTSFSQLTFSDDSSGSSFQTFEEPSPEVIDEISPESSEESSEESSSSESSSESSEENFFIPNTTPRPTTKPVPTSPPIPKFETFEFHNFKDLPKSFDFPGVNNTLANNLVNTIFNYVSVGGQLTGIPPVDLLLLRFYLHQGPENFCGPHAI